jgi:hypothetical protein
MKAAATLIAWNDVRDASWRPAQGAAPPGAIGIGPLLRDGDGDWPSFYACSGGAAYARRHAKGVNQRLEVLCDFYQLVYSYGINPYIAHRALLLIDEYRDVIKWMGSGPDKDEPGHDPTTPYGRAVLWPVPARRRTLFS